MSFSWIFGLIIGGLILFGAIYGVMKFSNVAETRGSATSATELGTIFDSLESASEDASSIDISFATDTKIQNNCDPAGQYGYQGIEIERYLKGSWSNSALNVEWENKYVFSDTELTGKTFHAFTKPIYFPYKVANLIYLTSSDNKYCFIDTPLDIKKEIKEINQENFFLSECPIDSIKVCFSSSANCDIKVNYNAGEVQKDGEILNFNDDSLMYAAIFSDKENYECETSRIMKRTKLLSELYQDKSIFIINKCESTVSSDLNQFQSQLSEYKDSNNLASIAYTKDTLEAKNKYARCKLW